MHSLRRYFTIWKLIGFNALQEAFVNRWSNLLFLTGKSLRFGMSLVFLFLIRQTTPQFSSYTTDQLIVFFLTYQLIDVTAQLIFRGVYLFSHQVRTGEFDFLLLKPINPLFRALTGKPDINDLIFIFPVVFTSLWIISGLDVEITAQSVIWYTVLLLNSLLIATAVHVFVLVVGILTTEVDGIMWLYRDVSRLGQFPLTVYLQPLRSLLFFLVPVGMMVTIPSQILLNTPPTYTMLTAILVGIGFFLCSLQAWNWALKRYSSASS